MNTAPPETSALLPTAVKLANIALQLIIIAIEAPVPAVLFSK